MWRLKKDRWLRLLISFPNYVIVNEINNRVQENWHMTFDGCFLWTHFSVFSDWFSFLFFTFCFDFFICIGLRLFWCSVCWFLTLHAKKKTKKQWIPGCFLHHFKENSLRILKVRELCSNSNRILYVHLNGKKDWRKEWIHFLLQL